MTEEQRIIANASPVELAMLERLGMELPSHLHAQAEKFRRYGTPHPISTDSERFKIVNSKFLSLRAQQRSKIITGRRSAA